MELIINSPNDKVSNGKVVVLFKKKRRTLVYSYWSIEDAYGIWASSGCVQEWKSIDELVREGFEDEFIEMLDPSRKEKVRKAVKKAGIKDGEPFIAFNPYNNDGFDLELLSFLPIDTPKKYLLERMIANGVKNFEVWEAESDETYGAFTKRILEETRCRSLKTDDLYRELCMY